MSPVQKRSVYLDRIPWREAMERLWQAWRESGGDEPLPGERVAVPEALGRITAEPVFAQASAPHFHASAMDGIAVRAEDTFDASETRPRRLRQGTDYQVVDTGDPIPEGFNAVIMVENVHQLGEDEVEIEEPISPWEHVRQVGEDIVATTMVLPANHRLTPPDLGALLAAGVTEVQVRRRPRVAVIPTGDEIVEPGTDLKPGDIIDSNSTMLAAMAQDMGAEASRWRILPDRLEELEGAVQEALAEHDLILVNAGSSAGRDDYSSTVVERLGRLLVHGVDIRPGGPVIVGLAAAPDDRKVPILGIPGYPVSAAITFQTMVRPVIAHLQGVPPEEVQRVEAILARRVVAAPGREEYLRVSLGRVGGKLVAAPLTRGASLITSLVRADGLVVLSPLSQGIEEGSRVEVELLRSPQEIERGVLAVGSHDLALDVLASLLAGLQPPVRLSSTNVGSMAGITALRRGEAHVAGMHLLDPATGAYNRPYLRRYLKGRRLLLTRVAHREQGLFVAKGNPQNIRGLEDLTRSDVTFMNRQRGSGTRILLDYELDRLEIAPDKVQGYDREEYTHMTVAAAVKSGAATVGMGIRAAAQALHLDFIPVTTEWYELAIPEESADLPTVRLLRETLRTKAYREAVAALGGYDTAESGLEEWLET